MQTLHLRFRDLRAISLRQGLSRWRTPSDAIRAGMKGPPGLSNSPGPTLAVGSRPANSRQRLARCPTVGAGLTLGSPLWEVRVGANAHPGRDLTVPTRTGFAPGKPPVICPHIPAIHKAGDLGADHWQARASEVRCTPSAGLSFPLVSRRAWARFFVEKTADPVTHVRTWAGVSSGVRACSHHGAG